MAKETGRQRAQYFFLGRSGLLFVFGMELVSLAISCNIYKEVKGRDYNVFILGLYKNFIILIVMS
jgi:hypothetical protein